MDMARAMEAVDRQSRKMEGYYGNNNEVNKVSVSKNMTK
jgi:RNA binding exosome subunit